MISLEEIGKLNVHLSKLNENQVVDVSGSTKEDTLVLSKIYNNGKYIIKGPIHDGDNEKYVLGFILNNNCGGIRNA